MKPSPPFDTLRDLPEAGKNAQYHSLPALEASGIGRVSRLPVSLRIVLEAVLRNCDGKRINEEHVRQLAGWKPDAERVTEIPFVVARVVLQDFTGVPLLCDLAAMRDVTAASGQDPKRIEPLVPVDLVVDHSVQVDEYGSPVALRHNMELEFQRNRERYQFMKWGMQAFDTFRVVPPGIGIVHQVNLEYLFRGVRTSKHGGKTLVFPDTLVGTDSHTTMINGVGVVGWGVGGIEAEAAMLGQPVYMLTPDVVGVEMTGALPEGVTATDLVLTVTEMLRREKVVGQFVEFFGEGASTLSVTDRATIANMAPEYGATMGFFPVDEKTVEYMRTTGRSEQECAIFESYYRAQGLFGIPRRGQIDYSRTLQLDLRSIVPSLAGPKRPQDRIPLPEMEERFAHLLAVPAVDDGFGVPEASLGVRFPTNLPGVTLGHGDILIAAITSCTNTSNPAVLIAAGLLAKKAVSKGLSVAKHIKTSLAPGSRVVTEYLERAGLMKRAGRLRLHDLYRQLGRPRAGTQPDHPGAGGSRGGRAVRQPQLRGAHPPQHPGQLPGLPATRSRLRDRRPGKHRPDQGATRDGVGRPSRLPQGHLADLRRDQRRPALRTGSGHLPATVRRFHHRARSVERYLRSSGASV
jgi:aconitate hydratase